MPWGQCNKPKDHRICEKCGKSYMPNNYQQKYCDDCKRKPQHVNMCVVCGRKSHEIIYSQKKKCSFCLKAEAKLRAQKNEAQKGFGGSFGGSIYRKCEKCGKTMGKHVWEFNDGLCETCYAKKKTEKVVTA